MFCRECLGPWLEQQGQGTLCPRCNQGLAFDSVAPLRSCNPLAHRCYSAIKVRCPVPDCQWVGDLSEMGAHLTSSDTHLSAASGVQAKSSAEAFKEQVRTRGRHAGRGGGLTLEQKGNAKFSQHQYQEAVKLYSKAISCAPQEAKYYGNRAACWLMLGAYPACIGDCKDAVAKDATYVRGYLRQAKALSELGDFQEAARVLAAGQAAVPSNAEIAQELRQVGHLSALIAEAKASVATNPMKARVLAAEILKTTQVPAAVLTAAEAELAIGNPDRALRLALDVLKRDSASTEAYAVSSRALYLKGDLDQALKHVKQALKLNPDDRTCATAFKTFKRVERAVERGREASMKRDFEAAIAAMKEALASDPGMGASRTKLAAEIYTTLANAHLRRKDYEECIAASTAAIEALDDQKAAYLSRSSANQAMVRTGGSAAARRPRREARRTDRKRRGTWTRPWRTFRNC